MIQVLARVEQLLRGEFTKPETLRLGEIRLPTRSLLLGCLLLGVVGGGFLGVYPAIRNRPEGFPQLLSTAAKVPLLYLFTLFVTFPSLYVFSALANSKLRFFETLRLLIAATGVNMAVMASLGPVLAFFALSTRSHAFMQVLTGLVFGIAGLVALAFLRRAAFEVFDEAPPPAEPETANAAKPPVLRRASVGSRARFVFMVWLVTYGVVGAQMAWILRPFLGRPGSPFVLFRGTESNFFRGFVEALKYSVY